MKKQILSMAIAMTTMALTYAEGPLDNRKVAVFIDADNVEAVANNQEKTAAKWLLANGNQALAVTSADLANLTTNQADVLWIHIDRCGLNAGSANLPAPFNNAEFLAQLKKYVKEGGNLLLSKHATQLATAIGRIDKEANCFSSGEGGNGMDTWTIQNVYGVALDEKLDRSSHAIYQGLTTINDFNNVPTVALLGTGDPTTEMWREDHNCFWIPADLGFGEGNGSAKCINDFESAYSCTCLGTWGHVGDFCGAGIIDFNPTDEFRGRVLAIGLAAYEWAPRNGGNAYHDNIEKLTSNALNYMSSSQSEVVELAPADEDVNPIYYTLQGIKVDNPQEGVIYIERRGASAKKVLF